MERRVEVEVEEEEQGAEAKEEVISFSVNLFSIFRFLLFRLAGV